MLTFIHRSPASEDFDNDSLVAEPEKQQVVDPSETNPAPEVEESKSEETASEEVFKFGEKEYSKKQIDDALYALENKDKWTTTNTNTAKELAEQRKLMEPFLKEFAPKLKSNPEMAEAIDDLWKDLTGAEEGISGMLLPEGLDSIPNPFQSDVDAAKSEAEAAQAELAELKADIALKEETSNLKKTYKGVTDRMIDTLAEGALKRFEDTGTWLSLEDVMKLDHPDWVNPRKALSTNNGTRSSTAPKTTSTPKSYNDVSDEAYAGLLD